LAGKLIWISVLELISAETLVGVSLESILESEKIIRKKSKKAMQRFQPKEISVCKRYA